MAHNELPSIRSRIDRIRDLSSDNRSGMDWFEAAMLAQTVLHDTLGGSHPLMGAIQSALEMKDYSRARGGARSVVTLSDEGVLVSPRLAIAHEIETDILDIAQTQLEAAETSKAQSQKQLQLAIAAFLAGATLEDALRRICIARGITFEAQRSSISKLQSALYQPTKQIEVISSSENKHITAWSDSRNKADHGKFDEITSSEVLAMVVGVRAFLDKHLP